MGCVHVYQPMSGLHDPVVIDTGVANFQDLRLTLVCDRGDLLGASEARLLCQHVGTLFENQGAQVTTWITGEGPDLYTDARGAEAEEPLTDLRMELRSREVHSSTDSVSWVLCILTGSIIPGLSETSFALDVVIRDGSGFLLASDTLEGRIVRRAGLGAWVVNKSLDRLWREEAEELTGDAASRELSEDLYGQLSQLLFNAKMQWMVLETAPPPASWN